MQVRVAELAQMVGGTVIGDDSFVITGISGLAEAEPGCISFLADARYAPLLGESRASVVLVRERQAGSSAIQIVVEDPNLAFAQVVEVHGPQLRPERPGIHPTAVIGDDVHLGDQVAIGAYAVLADGVRVGAGSRIGTHSYLGTDVRLGDRCTIHPQVTILAGCQLGSRVIVHAGAVIGSDGFGYASLAGVHRKIPQVGIVVIGDEVEIGANTTIDRARFGRTLIGAGTKIDNLVQIAHNVETGPHCIIVAQSGIAGSTRLGHHVTIAGQSGLTGHLRIGDQAIVAGKSGVSKNVPAKAVVQGIPAQELKLNQAQQISLRRLPKVLAAVKTVEARLAELEAELGRLRAERGA